MGRSVSLEYLFEVTNSSFELKFSVDDFFYDKSAVFVSVKEIILKASSTKSDSYDRIVKLISKNKSHPAYDKDHRVRNEFVNLAIFEINLQKDKEKLICVNSAPVLVNIENRKIEFEISGIFPEQKFDFTEVSKAFVRASINYVSN